MKRINLMVEDSQYEWLYQASDEMGISVAEIVRRSLDAWKKSQDVQDDLLFQVTQPVALFPKQGSGVSKAAIDELRQVVMLLTRAVRRTAPPDVMQEFDTRLEEWRSSKANLLPGGKVPPEEQ